MPNAATTPDPPPAPSAPSTGQLVSCAVGATLWAAPLFLLVWTATLALDPSRTGAAAAARGPIVFILVWGAVFIEYLRIYGVRDAGLTALDRVLVNPQLSLTGKFSALRANAVAYVFLVCFAIIVMKVAGGLL
jgi:hypothetical protein